MGMNLIITFKIIIIIIIIIAIQPFVGPSYTQSVDLLGRGISWSQDKQITRTFMPRVGFEPATPMF
jgi:hypothetical protein